MARRHLGEHPIVFFDGECNFCNGRINWIIKKDREGLFRFASLQSSFAEEAFRQSPLGPVSLDTMVLYEGGKWYTRSTAVLRICRWLPGGWKWLSLLLCIPRPLRDLGYRWFAANRYRLFGKAETCMMPTPEVRARFLGLGDGQERVNE
ncbi:thiol-disulfide oxidoreductase DCC [Laceyella sacchari]|jgi:predicted DCC family thiol-disulfide oxidoreductase YuxK|uniref:Predicted thiol-disulfide oxidoreductase YuxK, DCC family n=1 Tax=Laceyella tengchongensis TaxID=574699 RepID=A0AA45WSB4_9BACL|nr:thiol-disulfide oxidoreductase DCC family protein [Laceyella tengchongensis]AUS07790.1 thiol-disulfide oxidoreductase DCC [Laceyella sacchari]SMP36161.1 Predicted thiol-disulfide oxidoreductase YuxK, DCC family [Laceyella tengchongensis]